MNTLKILVATSTAFVALATAPYASAAGAADMIDHHAAMAQDFETKSAAANETAAAHRIMARMGGSPKANRQAMASHCAGLIAQYQAAAAEYAAKAAQHQQLSGKDGAGLTPERHRAATREFQAKVAVANAKVAEHEAMARAGGSPKSDGRSMSSHCEHLIAQYRADAESYAAQAAEHDRLAMAQ